VSDTKWMKPYLDQANAMMDRIAHAWSGDGPDITAEEIAQWRLELINLMGDGDADLMKRLTQPCAPENLVYIAGQIIGRESKRRKR